MTPLKGRKSDGTLEGIGISGATIAATWEEMVVLKGGVEKLRVPLEAEMLTKAVVAGDAKGEMPPDMRVMPMEPVVKSMAAAEGE